MKQMMNLNVHFNERSFNLGLLEVHKIKCSSGTLLEMIEKKLHEFNLSLGSKKVIVTADGAATNRRLENVDVLLISELSCQAYIDGAAKFVILVECHTPATAPLA